MAAHPLTWIGSCAVLASMTTMACQGLRAYAAKRTLKQRFYQYVALRPDAPSIATTGINSLAWLGRKIMRANSVKELQNLLLQAGLTDPAAPFIFEGLRVVTALAAFALTSLPAYLRHEPMAMRRLALPFITAIFIYYAFTILLKLRIEARQREIRRELPYVLDLVLMVLDSGVSVDQALRHVGDHVGKTAPISSKLLRRYNADTADGAPYDLALDRLAQRLAISEGRDFAGLLKQNLYQGGELTPALRRLAVDIGETRLAMAREQMGRKSVLLTLVMLAFFMPVLMVALAGPAVSDIVNTLSNVAHDTRTHRMTQ